MGERNPLQVSSTSATPITNRNPRGRPTKSQSVIFSTQPRSIVSQILEKMMIENNVILPLKSSSSENVIDSTPNTIEDETNQNMSNSPEVEESEDYLSPKPKHMICNRSVEKKKPRIYTCDFSNCLYSTKLSCNLQKHKRTHTSEKPYLCDICSFRTNFSNSLKVHRRLHTTERPYQCSHCTYRCNSISNLKKHSHTKHRDIKTFNEPEQ